MFSQQSSFRGMRTTLMCQVRMAWKVATEPSGWPPYGSSDQPWAQTNSVPLTLAPRSVIGAPARSTRRFPETERPSVPGAGGAPRVVDGCVDVWPGTVGGGGGLQAKSATLATSAVNRTRTAVVCFKRELLVPPPADVVL